MLVYVDIEHPKVFKDKKKREDHFTRIMDAKLKFEELSSLPCYVLHFLRIKSFSQKISQPHALLISGNSTDWSEYNFEWFNDINENISLKLLQTLLMRKNKLNSPW